MITPHLPLLFSPPRRWRAFLTTPDLRRHATRAPMATNPTAANGASIFQGVPEHHGIPGITYLPNEQRFDPKNSPFFNNQNFLQTGIPLALLPFTLPIARNFQYAYAQQGNLTIERQLGHDYKFSIGYSYTHAVHLNRPRNIDSTDPKLLTQNLRNALAAASGAIILLAWLRLSAILVLHRAPAALT